MRRVVAPLLSLGLVVTACSSNGGSSPTPVGRRTLVVFAASSLTKAFTKIGADFEAADPGVTVTFDFGASGDLATQIESEGAADVFARRGFHGAKIGWRRQPIYAPLHCGGQTCDAH